MNLEPPAYPIHQQINPLLHGRNPFTQGTLVGPTATNVSSQISAMLNPSAVLPAALAERINNSIATVTSVRREGNATRVTATIPAITAPVASSSSTRPTPFYVSYHRDEDGRLVSDMDPGSLMCTYCECHTSHGTVNHIAWRSAVQDRRFRNTLMRLAEQWDSGNAEEETGDDDASSDNGNEGGN